MTENEFERSAKLSVEEQKRAMEAANQNSAVARFVRIIFYIFGVLELLLALRVLLHALGANPGNGFADFVYAISNPFVAPFANLFANPVMSGTAVLELTTIAAMIVYAIAAWVIGRLIWLVLSRPR
jgi:YggT family protein